MLGLPGAGFTAILLSGILSRPPSMLSSLPPDVDVPLPLIDDLEPVVGAGAALGLEELAAGSPLVEPRPIGLPWANAKEAVPNKMPSVIAACLMTFPLVARANCSPSGKFRVRYRLATTQMTMFDARQYRTGIAE